MKQTLAIFICAFVSLGSAHAQNLYKWVDAEGNVTYQDQPPSGAGEADAFALDREVAAELSEAGTGAANAAANPVTLYSIPICDACDLVRNILAKNGVPFTEKNVDGDPSAQDEVMKLSGQLSVPLLAVGSNVVYGYNSRAITDELARAGYASDGAAGQDQPTLTPEEIAEQATAAAEELISEEEPLVDDIVIELDIEPEQVEEIPEDEQIRVGVSAE